jgi:hypothetical protein
MHYATAMCSLKSFADFDSVFQDPFDWQWTLAQTVRQGLAFQVFHYQIVDAIMVPTSKRAQM